MGREGCDVPPGAPLTFVIGGNLSVLTQVSGMTRDTHILFATARAVPSAEAAQ